MELIEGVGRNQPEDGIAEKFEALIIAGLSGLQLAAGGEPIAGSLLMCLALIGQRAMRQRVHQQFGARKAMLQSGFQYCKNGFHMLLDPIS
jgi:hypothetical protein